MSKPEIALACDLNDRTRDLATGAVEPTGIDLNFLPFEVEETFWRMLKHQEFQAAEMSMSSYLMARDQGWPELIAIPAFPSRFFRHSCVFINPDSGIEEPADLEGKNVGVPEYQMTASLMVRGMLQDQYGVCPEDMVWYHGGEEEGGREEKLTLDLPEQIELHSIPEDRTLSGMLDAGDLDALVSARAPSSFYEGSVERLFPDFKRVEKEYYQETGFFPIMHAVVLRQDVYDEHPWIAKELYKAFERSKQNFLERIGKMNELQVGLPWLIDELEETRDLMGWDYWPYGVEQNRELLDTMTRYSHQQGLTKEKLDVDELFAPNTYADFKV
ncbi:PhnD/SsuA/transferrin family substrate-binding protein [Halobellus captivus]|uniref:PhnD/SsuA/transferrin family substrate-binding protein n=1 Tax=Halobellus captivus TaxID=2592614 RepID=UPI0011A48022|nr:PhnD/SsuA/transferrin family substrate-binding protein [Halobellus captivus]